MCIAKCSWGQQQGSITLVPSFQRVLETARQNQIMGRSGVNDLVVQTFRGFISLLRNCTLGGRHGKKYQNAENCQHYGGAGKKMLTEV